MATENTRLGGTLAHTILQNAERVALIGIGGVGMCSIAHILLSQQKNMIGQDTHRSGHTHRLAEQGVRVFYHDLALPLKTGDAVIYTAAIPPTHPSLLLAKELHLPILSRADALAGLMQSSSPRVAIAGMHGKSTVTALLGHILCEGGLSPTVVCGAEMAKEQSPFLLGDGPFVFEACEYMASFLSFAPDIALLLNMEWEHIDCYPTFRDVKEAFSCFVSQSKELVLCYDEPALRPFAKQKTSIFYSLSDGGADVYAKEITPHFGGHRFLLCQEGKEMGEVTLPLVGKFNISNALGAAAVALRLGVSSDAVCRSLSCDKGVKRRLEHRGFLGNVPVFDDYAHHPTEITASLTALRKATKGKLYAVFQSHTYSRTKAFFTSLVSALGLADTVLVADIYPARETDTQGMSGETLARGIGNTAHYLPTYAEMAEYLLSHVRTGDTVVVMGAGNIENLFSVLPLSSSPK